MSRPSNPSPNKAPPPQAFISSYAPRLRNYGNALIAPVAPPPTVLPGVRTTKRGTTIINYAEDGFDSSDIDDDESGRRRPAHMRTLRRDDSLMDRAAQASRMGEEIFQPVSVQGVWRGWVTEIKKIITERQHQAQSVLPLTLIPIRIDLDIAGFRPEAAFPPPPKDTAFEFDESHPVYRQGDFTPAYKVKDTFLWNLHEALVTPDQFAKKFVDELDIPNDRKHVVVWQMTQQIREQLEAYAGIALHPLFHSGPSNPALDSNGAAGANTQAVNGTAVTGAVVSGTAESQQSPINEVATNGVTATAVRPEDDINNPDDAYRCIVSLNVNLMNKLYSDRFEWSLLHPPGLAEAFAQQTCADLGLSGEWVMSIAHAIYEAVLRLKKEVCENGGTLSLYGYGDIPNDSATPEAGWRYEPDSLAAQWEPRVEILTKDEIEKREGDRERQLRRVRRETARYSSTANMFQPPPAQNYFSINQDEDQPMGRGERSKKKKRFRSLSPLGRDPPDVSSAGYGGASALRDDERQYWRCSHCQIWGSAVWAVRDGPSGAKSLCHNCGLLFERTGRLPPWTKDYFRGENVFGATIRR